MDNYARIAQTLEPGAQQRRRLHVGGEYTAGTADEGVDTQAVNPLAQAVGIEVCEQRRNVLGPFGIAREERRVGFGVGNVHAAHTRQEKLAPHRRHAIVQVDLDPGEAQHLGRHQAGRAAADDDNMGRVRRAGIGHGELHVAKVSRRLYPRRMPTGSEQKTYSALRARARGTATSFRSGYPQAAPQPVWVTYDMPCSHTRWAL
ncbi:hypothetical protein D3C80_1279640 [compost metagenome]